MGRFANSWTVFKQSLEVLKKDKELLFLPVLSGLASLVMLATFLYPAYTLGLIDRAFEGSDPNAETTLYALLFGLYLVLSFITIFFQSALIHAANERLSGGDPTVGSALRGAGGRLGRILAWSLFAATVSLLIHALENVLRRSGNRMAGSILGAVLGTAWTFLTYFTIPVILFEDQGVFSSLRRSGQLFRQRWGESLVGEWGIGAAVTLLSLVAVLWMFLGAAVLGRGMLVVGVALIAIGVLWMLFMSILGQALGGIYKTALYRFARDGQVVPYFAPDAIRGAYHPYARRNW